MKYSQSTGCFYPDDIEYPSLLDDVEEVEEAEAQKAMARQPDEVFEIVRGKTKIRKSDGPTEQMLKAAVVARAQRLLAATAYTQAPDTAAELKNASAFADYRAQLHSILRDPPISSDWPTPPDPIWV